jgi:hypothetical protein
VAGIGLGRFRWKQDDVLPGDLTMDEVLQERLGDLGVPLVAGLPVEADQILGDLAARAARHGIDTPLVSAAYTHLRIYMDRLARAQ